MSGRLLLRRALVPFLALCLAASPAWAGKRRDNPDFVDDALAFVLTDRTKAVQLLEDAIEHPESIEDDALPLVMVHAGEQRRLLGDLEAARGWFGKVMTLGIRGYEHELARLGLTLVDAESGNDSTTIAILEEVHDKDALPTQNADRYLLLAVEATRTDDPDAVRDYSRKALGAAEEDPEVHDRVRARLEALAAGPSEPADPATTGTTPGEERLQTPLDQAEKALASGNPEKARKLAEEVLAGSPDETDARVASYLLRRIDAAPLQPGRVGVLLPMSGKYETAGRQVQEAIEYGFAQGGGKRKLVFVDSGSTAETAVEALEKMVLEDGVIAVMGPLLTDETTAVVEAADALRVPLIGLSQALEPTEDQEWIFQSIVTPRMQIEALLDWTTAHADMKAYAVFAPDNNYGRTASEIFQEEVAERGGSVTVIEYYDPTATDLLPSAKLLGRKDYAARAREFKDLKEAAEEKGGNPDRVVLPPTLDFDGLFLPDNASRVPIACAALAYEEFPIGDFKTSKDGETIPMLGLSGWNNPALVTQGGPYVRGSIFTDAFHPDTSTSEAFVEGYRAAFGRTPSALEVVSVDAGHLVASVDAHEADTRQAYRAALLAIAAEGTVTGATGFDEERHIAHRPVRVLTITEEEILPLDVFPPDPEEEGGTTPSGG